MQVFLFLTSGLNLYEISVLESYQIYVFVYVSDCIYMNNNIFIWQFTKLCSLAPEWDVGDSKFLGKYIWHQENHQ